MPIKIIRGQSDPIVDRILNALRAYEAVHPDAQIDLYRQSRFSVRIRVIDANFAHQSRVERSERIWNLALNSLDEETQGDISSVTLITREEAPLSLSNLEFENPVPDLITGSLVE